MALKEYQQPDCKKPQIHFGSVLGVHKFRHILFYGAFSTTGTPPLARPCHVIINEILQYPKDYKANTPAVKASEAQRNLPHLCARPAF